MKWFKYMVTGIDNSTVDVSRVLFAAGAIVFLVYAGYDVYKSGHFNMTEFSLAYSGLLASGAVGVRIKSSTEPSANEGK